MDRRKKRSMKAITDAFLNLLEEKSFKSITVEDIVMRSGYSKPTFYSNFNDKYGLMEYIINQETLEYIESMCSSMHVGRKNIEGNDYDVNSAFFARVLRKKGLYRLIFDKENTLAQKMYEERMVANAKEMLQINVDTDADMVDPTFVHRMSARSYMDFIRYWIDNDFRETPEWMAANYAALYSGSIVVKSK